MGIRGFGTIFGEQQTGDVGNVGIDLFFEMLFESLSKVDFDPFFLICCLKCISMKLNNFLSWLIIENVFLFSSCDTSCLTHLHLSFHFKVEEHRVIPVPYKDVQVLSSGM